MKKNNFTFILIILLGFFYSFNSFAQQERADIADKYKWDLTDIYRTESDWQEAKAALIIELPKIENYKGKLTQSAGNLLACFELSSKINREAHKLYLYANMPSDLDTRDMKYSGMKKELQQLFTDYAAKVAFIDPEILSTQWSVIEGFIKEEPKLKIYEKGLKDLFRQKKHTLSEPEERILALSNMATGTASSVYNTFKDAEMPNPEVTLSTSEKAVLSSSGYGKYRAASNRADRELVFKEFWTNYKNYQATYGETLYGQVKAALYRATARNYKSSLEAALDPKNVPTEVYHSLVENVNNNLPAFHRYLKIKKRMMGLDTLKYLDIYAPSVKGVDLKYNYEEGQKIILEALKPLGESYTSVVEKAFNERWIDVYPTTGKRSGAYSSGSYDTDPYILLNYSGLYDNVSTTAHELGHSMHSYLSNKNQPYPMAGYTIFVAEVASTFNEVLRILGKPKASVFPVF